MILSKGMLGTICHSASVTLLDLIRPIHLNFVTRGAQKVKISFQYGQKVT